MNKLLGFFSACGSIAFSGLFAYILIRSRINGIGWVAIMEPNDFIFYSEMLFLFPFFIIMGILHLKQIKKEGESSPRG